MSALALRDDQEFWDEKQLAVLHQTGIDADVTKPELAAFLHECQRRKLDPFIKQIYLLGRWDSKKSRKVYRSQTSIDGFRLIARRAADKAGIEYGYEGTAWFDAKGGRHEVWLSKEPPAAAKVVVVRNGQRFDAVAKYSEYVQVNKDGDPTGMWRSMPASQLAKCCEALALRKAFPEDLGGLYTEEEMAQADNPQRVQATVEVVHDEPRQAIAGEEDQAWAAQVASMSTFATEADGQELWQAVVARRKDGKINRAEDARLKDIIKARWAELNAPPKEGTVVPGLDPADSWAQRVEDITSEDDAATLTEEVIQASDEGQLADAKAAAIHAAISRRVASLAVAA